MDLGTRLRMRRKQIGLSQEQLGELVNFHVNTVRRWENGSRSPDAGTLQEIAKALDTTTAYLLGEMDAPQALAAPAAGASSPQVVEGKNVVPPVGGSDAPVVFQIGEMRLELPPTPETYAFLERQLKGVLPTGERLPEPSQEDAGEQSA